MACVLMACAGVNASEIVIVQPDEQHQTWDGWGTSLSWWAHNIGQWSETNRAAIADLVFTYEQGLGLNVVRYNIGGEDDPTHDHMRVGGDIPSFRPKENEPYDWTADASQREMLNLAIARGANLLEAFACSPPYWMTVSGCSAGATHAKNDNLDPQYYEAYADYLTDILLHFRDEWGIPFDTLAPFNEPLTHYWQAGKEQQGCHFAVETQQKILRLMARQLRAKGLRTELSAADETCTEHCVLSFGTYEDDVKALVKQMNTHTYSSSWDRKGPRYLADKYGKRLHMTEICFASRVGEEGHNHVAVDGSLELAASITRDLKEMQPQAWVFWQPVENEDYCIWWKFNYGLIHADVGGGSEAYTVTKKYYGFGQYTRFIRPGYRMIGVDAADTVAFVDPQADRLVLVTYNQHPAPRERRYELGRFTTMGKSAQVYRTSDTEELAELPLVLVQDGGLFATEPGRSVTTYVLEGATYQGSPAPRRIERNDTDTGPGPHRVEYEGDWQYMNTQAGAFVSDNHWSQNAGDQCTIHFDGAGVRLYAATGPNLGIAEVSLNGGPAQWIDFYAEERRDQTRVYTSPPLQPGPHELTVRVTGEKHPESTEANVPIDRIDIEPAGMRRTPAAGYVYEDTFTSDPTLNPGLVTLPGGDDSYLGYSPEHRDLYFQSHDTGGVGARSEGGGCLQLAGVRFKAGRRYRMTVEAAPWPEGYDAELSYQAGFFPEQPTSIDQRIPIGASGTVTAPKPDGTRKGGPYVRHTWTFVPHQDATDPWLLFRTARPHAEPSRIAVNRIRVEEQKTDPREPLRILCVGDSITAGYTTGTLWEVDPFAFGYRSGLFTRLLENDIPCQFVGSSPQPYNLAYNIQPPDTLAGKLQGPDLRRFGQDHHQGWAGAGISGGIQSNIVAWIEEEDPDVILLMVGINAIPEPTPEPVEQQADLEILVRTILTKFAKDQRAAHLIVAQITPRSVRFPSIEEYNRFIREDLVPTLQAEGAPISTVDQYANFLDATGAIDPAMFAQINHPNNRGYARMAQSWYKALLAAGLLNSP